MVDLSFISGMTSALSAARGLIGAAIDIRDGAKLAEVMAQTNQHIIKAQESLLSHQAQMLALQQELFDAEKSVKELQSKLAERGRYRLHELAVGRGVFVYRFDGSREDAGAEPSHFVCQRCFDAGVKVVLMRSAHGDGYVGHRCSACGSIYVESDRIPMRPF